MKSYKKHLEMRTMTMGRLNHRCGSWSEPCGVAICKQAQAPTSQKPDRKQEKQTWQQSKEDSTFRLTRSGSRWPDCASSSESASHSSLQTANKASNNNRDLSLWIGKSLGTKARTQIGDFVCGGFALFGQHQQVAARLGVLVINHNHIFCRKPSKNKGRKGKS